MRLTRRSIILGILLVAGLSGLAFEVMTILPHTLQVWHPFDYGNYIEMGHALRDGRQPYGLLHHYYPLPTMVWIFVPLSLLPEWFQVMWVIIPILFILILLRMDGLGFLLFPPVWFATADGMLDGWLLIPLKWLFEDRPLWAGLGAALLLFKPQLAFLPVLYRIFWWVRTRNSKNLAAFFLASLVFCVPAFIIDPVWPLEMLTALSGRVEQNVSLAPLLTSSVWSWWFLGGAAWVVFFGLVLVGVFLFRRAVRRNSACWVSACQSANLFLLPILFASTSISIIPAVRGRVAILALVLVSLGAYGLDRRMNGFGGGYALIPLVALFFQAQKA